MYRWNLNVFEKFIKVSPNIFCFFGYSKSPLHVTFSSFFLCFLSKSPLSSHWYQNLPPLFCLCFPLIILFCCFWHSFVPINYPNFDFMFSWFFYILHLWFSKNKSSCWRRLIVWTPNGNYDQELWGLSYWNEFTVGVK